MGFFLNTPGSVDIQETSTVSKNVEVCHGVQITFNIDPVDPTLNTMRMVWTRGYDGADGYFVQVDGYVSSTSGSYVNDALDTVVTPGNTFEEEMVARVWACLDADCQAPDGYVI